jgi:hypothetical protein
MVAPLPAPPVRAPCLPQSDARQLGVANIPASLLPPTWRVMARGGRLPLPLDGANLHAFLTSVPDEEARRQVGSGGGWRDGGVGCQPSRPTHRPATPLAPSSPRRPQAYVAGHSSPASNLQLLDHIIECRWASAHARERGAACVERGRIGARAHRVWGPGPVQPARPAKAPRPSLPQVGHGSSAGAALLRTPQGGRRHAGGHACGRDRLSGAAGRGARRPTEPCARPAGGSAHCVVMPVTSPGLTHAAAAQGVRPMADAESETLRALKARDTGEKGARGAWAWQRGLGACEGTARGVASPATGSSCLAPPSFCQRPDTLPSPYPCPGPEARTSTRGMWNTTPHVCAPPGVPRALTPRNPTSTWTACWPASAAC